LAVLVTFVVTVKWAIAVLQLLVGSALAYSLAIQKLPSLSTLMPLRSPARPEA
jgi:hypothetical protein